MMSTVKFGKTKTDVLRSMSPVASYGACLRPSITEARTGPFWVET